MTLNQRPESFVNDMRAQSSMMPQRLVHPWERQDFGSQKKLHTQSLNRDFSVQSMKYSTAKG